MKPLYAFAALLLVLFAALALYLGAHPPALLSPQGLIALNERSLMFHAVELMLIVVIPVLFLAFYFAWHYRAGNTKALYTPEWEHSKMDELVWWAVPLEIVLILAALTWSSTHELDPKAALPQNLGTPLTVEVVALPWKWLFIYPSLGVASLNALTLPANRPVTFEITADAPMNSFWIPALGGQIYAMTGMVTMLNLIAQEPGAYAGGSANYSGDGFAYMHFTATALPPAEFDAWAARLRLSSSTLGIPEYRALETPGAGSVAYYGAVAPNLFDTIVAQFVLPSQAAAMDMH